MRDAIRRHLGLPVYTYQWRRCDAHGGNCADIAGATSDTYLLTAADVGFSLRVVASNGAVADESAATAPVSAPVSTAGRWFADTSYINKRVGASPTLDPSSAFWIGLITAGPFLNGTSGVGGGGSTTVYHANGATPTRTITLEVAYNGSFTIVVPMDPSWVVSGTDNHIAIIDDRDDNYWEFQNYDPVAHTAHAVARAPGTGSILTSDGAPDPPNSAVSVLPTVVGLIRPEEVVAGVIPHGLRCAVQWGAVHLAAGSFRYPALRSDGNTPNGIPGGAHLWLPRGVNLASFGLNAYQTMVAVACQEYGLFVGDSGGGFAIYAQSTADGVTSYPFSSLSLPLSLAQQMKVLAAGQ